MYDGAVLPYIFIYFTSRKTFYPAFPDKAGVAPSGSFRGTRSSLYGEVRLTLALPFPESRKFAASGVGGRGERQSTP